MRPPALMRGPSRKPRCQACGRTREPRHIHQADVAGALAAAQRQQPLGDERAIEPDERYHVGDGAERDVVEQRQQIRLRPIRAPKTAPAQHAVHRYHRHEHEPDGGQVTETGEVVAPVRIDDGNGRRQRLVGLMMIDDDHVDAQRARLGERLDAGGAAIDRHQERGAARRQRPHRFDVRARSLRTGGRECG